MMEARQIVCNACGSDRYVPLSSVDGWTIGRCDPCELVYVNPAPFFEPTEEFSGISRDFEYTQYMHQPITDRILAFERRQLEANAEKLLTLGAAAPGPANPRRFLDIGCGSGAAVKAATDLGWHAMGIDLDPQLVNEGRQQLNVDLRCGVILESDLPAGAFDFVKMRDVVEHLPNPLAVLAKVSSLLAPGGLALFVTPNEGGLATRTKVMLGRKRVTVATVPPPHHLHSFTPATLESTLRRAGLQPIETFSTTPMDWRYVTSHNEERALQSSLYRPIWRAASSAGLGAVLVSWARAT